MSSIDRNKFSVKAETHNRFIVFYPYWFQAAIPMEFYYNEKQAMDRCDELNKEHPYAYDMGYSKAEIEDTFPIRPMGWRK